MSHWCTHRRTQKEKCHRTIVEHHVINQLANLRSYPYIREAENQGELTLPGWIEDLIEQALYTYNAESEQFDPA